MTGMRNGNIRGVNTIRLSHGLITREAHRNVKLFGERLSALFCSGSHRGKISAAGVFYRVRETVRYCARAYYAESDFLHNFSPPAVILIRLKTAVYTQSYIKLYNINSGNSRAKCPRKCVGTGRGQVRNAADVLKNVHPAF